MWIKEPPEPLEDSGHDNLNFLFNEGKFYIMDNHLAAAWCWLQKIDTKSTYNLLHIDKHYDLLDSPIAMKEEVADKGIDLPQLSLSDYLDLKQPIGGQQSVKLFRYDNYIGNLKALYPDLFEKCYFATHKDGSVLEDFISQEPEIYELESNLAYWIKSNGSRRWIINIDIDYFYNTNHNDEYYQFLADDYIKSICNQIEISLEFIDEITIAMSPSFCNGWNNSLRTTKVITDYFKLPFNLQL